MVESIIPEVESLDIQVDKKLRKWPLTKKTQESNPRENSRHGKERKLKMKGDLNTGIQR